MESSTTTINQKEYLKRYLSIGKAVGKKKKKREKQKSVIANRVRIIDDDIDDITHINTKEEADELLGGGEDAPQIVGIVDDRPLSMKIDDYRKSDLWKPLSEITEKQDKNSDTNADKDESLADKKQELEEHNVSKCKKSRSRWNTDESSPDRSKDSEDKCYLDLTPPILKTCNSLSDEDLSPPRPGSKNLNDLSPHKSKKFGTFDSSQKDNDSDLSPPRQKKSTDLSSPRVRKRDNSSFYQKHDSNSDLSPPRPKKSDDLSPVRPRSSNKTPSRDLSPPRPKKNNDISIGKTERKRPLPFNDLEEQKKNKYIIPQKRSTSSKMKETLEGKKAGLQSAQELIKENEAFKNSENKMFESLNDEVSGKNATAVLRDRKTGKIRDLKKEAEEKRKKAEKEAENKEKYMKWGKGLKQVQDHNEKLEQDLHEMNKPLARYADDNDLETYLKEQEREGDPMLAYIRKKKKKQDKEAGKPEKLTYEGEFMPNRFSIRPGHRWDGVDRSNGYEKKWFEVQNSQRAQQEDVYKWSTEDM